jgi:hypothetical protein
MAADRTVRCAAESREREEPLHGTASRVRRWLLIEQAGPWGSDALLESRIPGAIAVTVQARASNLGIRPLLIRRPGWPDDVAPRRVYLAHTAPGSGWIEQLELDDPAELLGLDLSAFVSAEPPGVGRPGPESVHLVCTNGRHDPCCADLGRPVARALEEAGVPEVWESSHVGGDRFAANVVCLPSGAYFGRVEPESAAALIADHGRGVLWLDHYRGRSSAPPLLQSAEIFARRHLDERRLDGLRVVRSVADSDDRLTAVFASAGPGDETEVEVVVTRRRDERAPLTCSAPGGGHPWRYELESLSPSPAEGSGRRS